jgi:hypothetical protein
MVGALPGDSPEATRCPVHDDGVFWKRILQRLKRRADIVAQALEPCSCARLAGFQLSNVHQLLRPDYI